MPDLANDSYAAVHLLDDDLMTVIGASAVLEHAGLPARAFTDPDEFTPACSHATRGCVVLGHAGEHASAGAWHERLVGRGLTAPVLYLVGQTGVAEAVGAMRRGAFDVVRKPLEGDALVAAVRRAFAADAARAVTRGDRSAVLRRWQTLSPRERHVCRLIATGAANKRVAYELSISQRTVETHRARAMTKMGADSFPALVLMYAACAGEDETIGSPAGVPNPPARTDTARAEEDETTPAPSPARSPSHAPAEPVLIA